MRKVYVDVLTRLIITCDEGVEVAEVLAEMDYDFTSKTEGATIEDMEIRDTDITDSK